MSYVFVYGSVGVSIEYVVEDQGIGTGLEAGVRVELRRVDHLPGHRPSAEGFTFPPLRDAGIWRADLLVEIDPPTYKPYHHHHPQFSPHDVGRRFYDDGIMADPVGWTADKLRHLDILLRDCGAAELVEGLDMDEVERSAPLVRAALDDCFSRVPAQADARAPHA